MYLATGHPDKALEWADKVVNTPEYKLVTERYGVRSSRPGVPFWICSGKAIQIVRREIPKLCGFFNLVLKLQVVVNV